MEKPSMMNTIARAAMRQRIPERNISMMNLLDEQSLDKIVESAGTHLWKGFITFRSASAGILAGIVFIIVRLIKLIIVTIIHGYALHSISIRCGIHPVAAIWSSVIHLFFHLGKPIKTKQGDEEEQ